MSLGFSVGDLIAAGTLAYDLCQACCKAGQDYNDLAQLCSDINVAVDACRPNDPHTILRRQDAQSIYLLSSDCKSTLERLERLLSKYQNMSTVQTIGKRMGFINAKSERQEIRSRLGEHLATINLFLNGAQVGFHMLTVRLLLKIIEEKNQDSGQTLDVSAVANDTNLLQDLLNEFGSESSKTKAELEKDRDDIRQKLLEVAQGGCTEAKPNPDETSILKSSDAPSNDAQTPVSGPAPTKRGNYDPWSFSWFANSGYKYLWPVSVEFAFMQCVNLQSPVIRYTERDEWLSFLPEGWSLTRTVGIRADMKEDAYYLSFNNLSCRSDIVPRTSRLYYLESSLVSADPVDIIIGGLQRSRQGKLICPLNMNSYSRFYWNLSLFSGVHGILAPPIQVIDRVKGSARPSSPPYQLPRGTACMGFIDNYGIPFDLNDELTNDFAIRRLGNNGKPMQYSDDDINQGLPDDWVWERDLSGEGHHVYKYLGTVPPTESTVHPARFYREGDGAAVCLPPRWDRRLDIFGNLFFVDHNTKSAVREDPRFNPRIDQKTGLPLGWHCIWDNEGQPFFYAQKGKAVIGTYQPSSINSKSLDNKHFISCIPKDGDQPLNSVIYRKRKINTAPRILKANVPAITEEERLRYNELFKVATAKNKWKISWEEADAQCRGFGLPSEIYQRILNEEDKNKDRFFTPSEYANALHRMRFALQEKFEREVVPQPTQKQLQDYLAAFEAFKSPDGLEMTLDEATSLTQGIGLPQELVKEFWLKSDTNHDSRWDIDEFVDAFHRITVEVNRREALSKIGGAALPLKCSPQGLASSPAPASPGPGPPPGKEAGDSVSSDVHKGDSVVALPVDHLTRAISKLEVVEGPDAGTELHASSADINQENPRLDESVAAVQES